MTHLATARLSLRPFVMDDVEDCLAMDLDPEVHRYIYFDGPPDAEAHRAKLRQRVETGWPETGQIWTVEWRDDPGFLGWCGLFPLEDSGFIEIGYRFRRAAWGQGVASEAGRAVLRHGFTVFGFDPIVGVTHPENPASQRVLEKIGLSSQGRARHYGLEVLFYRLDRRDYVSSGEDSA